MQRKQVLETLETHMPALRSMGVKSLALFGSTARNQASAQSDLDFLIEFTSSPGFDRYMEIKFYLEDLFLCRVDLIIAGDLKPLARAEVEKEAIYVA